MLPDTGTGGDEATSGVPVNISDAVVVRSVHKLQVGSEIFVTFRLLTLEVQVEELHLETLLRVDSGNNNETTSRRPVDGIAVFLIVGSDVLEVTNTCSLDLLRAIE